MIKEELYLKCRKEISNVNVRQGTLRFESKERKNKAIIPKMQKRNQQRQCSTRNASLRRSTSLRIAGRNASTRKVSIVSF